MNLAQIHYVRSISVEYTEAAGSRWVSVNFTDATGNRYTVTAFVDGPLVIEGADLMALMAAGESK